MYFFLIILLPLSFIAYCFFTKDKQIVPVSLAGFFTAVVVCLIKVIFTYAHRIVPYSVADNFLFYFIRQTFLPVVLLYGIFIAISRDSIEFKIKSYFPLMVSFFMIYMPFVIIAPAEPTVPAYQLFVKPLMILAMIVMQSLCLKTGFNFIKNKKIFAFAISCAIFILYLVLPSLLESLYLVGTNFVLVCIISAIYIFVPLAYVILKFVNENFLNNKLIFISKF